MQQELMRAVVLLSQAVLEDAVPILDAASLQELRALTTILRRASRACEGRVVEELEATASGLPQPEHT